MSAGSRAAGRKRRPIEPLLWLLFSGGGVMAGLFFPILVLLFGLAFPLGWIDPPSYADLHGLFSNWITRLVLFGVCMLALFHFAHRFRFTLWDGLQLKHGVITAACYGTAVVGTVLAAILLLQL
ncbi:MAG: hypothetical protein L0Y54_02105 [Sporichthyaceae bacterium]|nr:hypothetical protein [Sporichthyaceae bacterium]